MMFIWLPAVVPVLGGRIDLIKALPTGNGHVSIRTSLDSRSSLLLFSRALGHAGSVPFPLKFPSPDAAAAAALRRVVIAIAHFGVQPDVHRMLFNVARCARHQQRKPRWRCHY